MATAMIDSSLSFWQPLRVPVVEEGRLRWWVVGGDGAWWWRRCVGLGLQGAWGGPCAWRREQRGEKERERKREHTQGRERGKSKRAAPRRAVLAVVRAPLT